MLSLTPGLGKRIWLVGTSLGGHGALLYLSEHPRDIYATVVLAPFLADFITHLQSKMRGA